MFVACWLFLTFANEFTVLFKLETNLTGTMIASRSVDAYAIDDIATAIVSLAFIFI